MQIKVLAKCTRILSIRIIRIRQLYEAWEVALISASLIKIMIHYELNKYEFDLILY